MIPLNESSNLKLVIKDIENKTSNFNKGCVVLLDGDRTLCEPDTSRMFNKIANINFSEIKDGFVKHGYTYPGFKNMAEIYSRLDILDYKRYSKKTAKNIELYPGVLEFIKCASEFADICIVTSGVKKIWENILNNNNLENVLLLGGTHNNVDDYIIGRYEKGQITEFFTRGGQILVAFGDSDVDSLMLKKADHAVIVVNHRNNADLLSHLDSHSSLYQISFKNYHHANIRITDFKKISNIIMDLLT
ncbi:hypothetical protein LCGC14_0491730 [marine sediment metagenome]|uniref:Haloacid dehalogenase-like hydrolase n=1 Tax=marine sediment metagenome TaxID=412755 RepID=A0A0F9S6D7_9ZZZZ